MKHENSCGSPYSASGSRHLASEHHLDDGLGLQGRDGQVWHPWDSRRSAAAEYLRVEDHRPQIFASRKYDEMPQNTANGAHECFRETRCEIAVAMRTSRSRVSLKIVTAKAPFE
jgi:hypothetical protein